MSILDEASKVKLTPFELTTLGQLANSQKGPDISPSGKLLEFAEPYEINELMSYFDMKPSEMVEAETSDKVKFIYQIAKKSGEESVSDFLGLVGLKIGGKMTENLLGKMYKYLGLLKEMEDSESSVMKRIKSKNNNIKGRLGREISLMEA